MSNSDIGAQGLSKKDDTKICLQPDCDSKPKARGLCSKHGGRPVCKFSNCKKIASKSNGFCTSHGPRCSAADCPNSVKAYGFCNTHGPVCAVSNCSNQRWTDKCCKKHRNLHVGMPSEFTRYYDQATGNYFYVDAEGTSTWICPEPKPCIKRPVDDHGTTLPHQKKRTQILTNVVAIIIMKLNNLQ